MDQEARAEQARRQILYNIGHCKYPVGPAILALLECPGSSLIALPLVSRPSRLPFLPWPLRTLRHTYCHGYAIRTLCRWTIAFTSIRSQGARVLPVEKPTRRPLKRITLSRLLTDSVTTVLPRSSRHLACGSMNLGRSNGISRSRSIKYLHSKKHYPCDDPITLGWSSNNLKLCEFILHCLSFLFSIQRDDFQIWENFYIIHINSCNFTLVKCTFHYSSFLFIIIYRARYLNEMSETADGTWFFRRFTVESNFIVRPSGYSFYFVDAVPETCSRSVSAVRTSQSGKLSGSVSISLRVFFPHPGSVLRGSSVCFTGTRTLFDCRRCSRHR